MTSALVSLTARLSEHLYRYGLYCQTYKRVRYMTQLFGSTVYRYQAARYVAPQIMYVGSRNEAKQWLTHGWMVVRPAYVEDFGFPAGTVLPCILTHRHDRDTVCKTVLYDRRYRPVNTHAVTMAWLKELDKPKRVHVKKAHGTVAQVLQQTEASTLPVSSVPG